MSPFLSDNCYFCTVKERINWIDWAKALAVCTVVFCHLPQSQEWFYYRYLQACIITIFFFLSGYLKRDRGSQRANWQKYWHGLILPYLIYNALVYPYWIVKYYMHYDALPDLFHALRPLLGALLCEHQNAFCEPLNGPLWYLPAILIMHVTIDFCRKTRHQHLIMVTLCIASFFLYAANKYWQFLPNLTPIGIFRRLPYYYLGYVMGQYHLFRRVNTRESILGLVGCLSVSLLLFYWHLHEDIFLLHIALFYPVNIGFLFGVLYGCKLLDKCSTTVVTNLSVGTLVIIGLHIVLITVTNYIMETYRGLDQTICYHWYEALPITIAIVGLLYPVILIGRRYTPQLLGR